MKFSEFYRLIEADGWYLKTTKKHKKYVHPTKQGFIPVEKHKSAEVPTGTLESMKKRAGIK
ncbi:MAG: type II toxin-antitoxin system HicA family toxin [Holosporales bacterium]|jgi:predicted RNA binding protein YcfA (HicA-like mRNA interferase family)|nr:type II toxin-antitoxin system HicA family toxin [Holosporales bacterium]